VEYRYKLVVCKGKCFGDKGDLPVENDKITGQIFPAYYHQENPPDRHSALKYSVVYVDIVVHT
jgi:hypothetical protein